MQIRQTQPFNPQFRIAWHVRVVLHMLKVRYITMKINPIHLVFTLQTPCVTHSIYCDWCSGNTWSMKKQQPGASLRFYGASETCAKVCCKPAHWLLTATLWTLSVQSCLAAPAFISHSLAHSQVLGCSSLVTRQSDASVFVCSQVPTALR